MHPHEGELREFMRLDYHRLVAALGTVTGSDSIAEDLVQDALVRVLTARARGTEVDRLGGLVRVTALNLAKNRWRSRGRERSAMERHRVSWGVGDRPTEPSADALDLRAALLSLPPREREAAALFYQLDLSVGEVAELMGVSPGTVKTLLHRARADLLHVMKPKVET